MNSQSFSKIWIIVILIALIALIAGGILAWQHWGGLEEKIKKEGIGEGSEGEEEITLIPEYPEEYIIYQDYLETIGDKPRTSDIGTIEATVVSITESEACPYPEERCIIEPYPKDVGVVRIDKIINYTPYSEQPVEQPMEQPSGEEPPGGDTTPGYRGIELPSPKQPEYEPLHIGQEVPISFLLTTRPVKVRYVSIPPAGEPEPGPYDSLESELEQPTEEPVGEEPAEHPILPGEPLPRTYRPIPREGEYLVFTTKIIEYPEISQKILPGLEIESKFRAEIHYAGSLYLEEYEVIPPAFRGACEEIPVLVLNYFPDEDGDGRLDPEITGMDYELEWIRNRVNEVTSEVLDSLEQGSTYHGYKDSSATPSLNYRIYETNEFLYKIPLSDNLAWGKPGVYRPDYYGILSDLDICHYVDNLGVKQVWMWGYHYGDTEPDESNMAMGYNSQEYWNHGTYGDVSNGQEIDDMPACQKTYTLYNYAYPGGAGFPLENHAHQLEHLFNFIDRDLFWDNFVNPYGPGGGVTHCGWTHYPPNGRWDYDWMNQENVESNCEDWHPDGSGEVEQVNCYTWGDHTCPDDAGASFKIWWMQNIPGRDNNLIFEERILRNWWDFSCDFDLSLGVEKSLTY